jgi:two-component system sensor histidine kinase KdpD
VIARIAVGLALVVVSTTLLAGAGADLAAASPALMLAVVGASLLGYASGIAAALTCFAALNYFFTPPVHSFAIDRTDDLVALVICVAVAAIVGTGIARLNTLRAKARQSEREAELRLTFTNELVGGLEPGAVLDAAAHELVTLFDLVSCEIATADGLGRARASGAPSGALTLAAEDVRLNLGLGRVLDRGELRTIEALAASFGTALERQRFDTEARERRVQSELDRSRAGFLTAVTHDLRTPLATIKAGTGALLLADGRVDDDHRRDVLQALYDETTRLERLITNVLELTRIRAGVHPDPAAVSAADLVRAAMRRLDRVAGDRAIRLDIDPDLPALWGDPAMLESIVVNLVENALRHSSADKPIDISAEDRDCELLIRVVDHGEGIGIDQRDRVFEEFVRLDPGSSSSGTGLGLSIARAFAEGNGGRVWYEDTPGGGATFVMALPLDVREVFE